MGVSGEKRWNAKDEAVKRTFEPVPPQDWETKLITDWAEIAAGNKEKGGIPFIKGVRFTCYGSAMVEGGKDRAIFQNFFLSLKPGKDGNVMPDYANQLNGLMKGLGDIRDFAAASKVVSDDGDEVEYLNPKEVLAYLKSHNGDVIKLHSKIENDALYGKKGVVDYFIEADSAFENPAEEEEASEEVEEVTPKKKRSVR